MAEEPQGPVVREKEVVTERPAAPPTATPPCQPPETSALALASLATGIAAWFIFPVAGAIAAIVTGFLAQNEIRASGGRLTGTAFATAGLVLGWLQIGLIILGVILFVIFASAAAPGFHANFTGLLPALPPLL